MSLFGEEVRRLREGKGMSQQALADQVGLTQGAIGHIETGRRQSVGSDVLYKLCDALGVSCDHFRPFANPGVDPSTPPPAPVDEPKKSPAKKGKK